MTRLCVIALASLVACTRPATNAPSSPPSRGVVIMSMHDVEPYERVPPPTPTPPPAIEVGAPLYGALAGAAMGVVVNTGLTLLTERRWPGDRTYERGRTSRALLYGAGIGLVGGTYALAHSIAERMKWREKERERERAAR